jgi:hypothetical protein
VIRECREQGGMILTGKTEELGDKHVPVPLYPPQISHGLAGQRTRASMAIRGYAYYKMLKLKLSHYTPRRRRGERRYSSYSFSNSALDGGEWSASRPGRALAPGKGPQVPTVQEAGWAPEPVWTQRLEEKFSARAGDRTSIARSSSP